MFNKSIIIKGLFTSFAMLAMVAGGLFGSTLQIADKVHCSDAIAKCAREDEFGRAIFNVRPVSDTESRPYEEMKNFAHYGLPNFANHRNHYDGLFRVDPRRHGLSPNLIKPGEWNIPMVGMGLLASSTLKEKNGLFPMESAALSLYFDYEEMKKIVGSPKTFSFIISDVLANKMIGYEPETLAEKKAKYLGLIGNSLDVDCLYSGEAVTKSFQIYNVYNSSDEDGGRIRHLFGDGAVFGYGFSHDYRYGGKSLDILLGGSSHFIRSFLETSIENLRPAEFEYSFYTDRLNPFSASSELGDLFGQAFLTPPPQPSWSFYVFLVLYLLSFLSSGFVMATYSAQLNSQSWILLLIGVFSYALFSMLAFGFAYSSVPFLSRFRNGVSMLLAFAPVAFLVAQWPIGVYKTRRRTNHEKVAQ